MFSNKDIVAYYDTTQNHYEKWWKLKDTLALHYGIWNENTRNFKKALLNTNQVLIDTAKITANDSVLDAGCGIGGSSQFIAKSTKAKVLGISLSEKQIANAQLFAKQNGLSEYISFKQMDYTQTAFKDESFDVVWAIESVCHADDKNDFIKEAYRILKKGGRLIMSDFYLSDQKDKNNWIKKWCDTWGVPNLITTNKMNELINDNGFSSNKVDDYTLQIHKSAKRLYYASLIGALPSELYNITHPKVSRFAKTHYKCGYYQYKALMAGLWKYKVVLATK